MQDFEERHGYRIGELAAEFKLNPKTLRYYEEIGLIDAPVRSLTGYRLYTETDSERLNFVLKAKAAGLTLKEISEILKMRQEGYQPCEQVRSLLDSKIAALDELFRALTEYRQELVTLREMAAENLDAEGRICGIIEQQELSDDHERMAGLPVSVRSLGGS